MSEVLIEDKQQDVSCGINQIWHLYKNVSLMISCHDNCDWRFFIFLFPTPANLLLDISDIRGPTPNNHSAFPLLEVSAP